jgi:alkylation response protein AidB-like acyl-CoA dehydrogenase
VFRASVPKAIGGDEVDLITQLETFEELARADASVGWCAMIGAQTGTLAALLEPEAAKEIYGDANVRTGGVFAPSGRAVADGDSFRLSGRWSFGSGVAHTDWYALGAVVMDGEQLRTDGDRPDLRFVFVPTSQLDIEDTWDVSGLRGTGSNHISVENVVVPDRHTFPLLTPKRRHPGPLYRFPLFSALAAGVSSVALGVARDAIDELDELASTKTPTGATRALGQRSAIQIERARAEAELCSARAFLFDTGAELWTHAASGDDPTIEQRASLRLAATHAVRTAADVVDRAYDAGGGTAIFSTSRLQRTFRDVHAITQHLIVSPPTFELVGRVLLGVETDVSQL